MSAGIRMVSIGDGTVCTVHTHSKYCDGYDTVSAMAKAAYRAGAVTFGASSHSHTSIPGDGEGGFLPKDMTAYRTEVQRLREEYAGRMDVLCGIELDSFADVSPEGLDYWIGSVHYVRHPETGTYHCIDWDREKIEAGARDFGGMRPLVEAYYKEAAALARRRPTILGHWDLITKLNGQGDLFDESSDWYREAALSALDAADPEASLLEINTGAVYRGFRTAPYPAGFLLEAWRKRGGRVIVTADAHHRKNIVADYDTAFAAARTAGYDCTAVLTRP